MFLFAAVTPPAFAKNTYELTDGFEGDPGDGVLNPAKQPSSLVMPQYTTIGGTTDGGSLWRLPVFVLPAGLSGLPLVFTLPADLWRQPMAHRAAPGTQPSGGRWHHAR